MIFRTVNVYTQMNQIKTDYSDLFLNHRTPFVHNNVL